MTESGAAPASAARLAELLGNSLPRADSIPAPSFDLVSATRRLVEAVVLTDVEPADRDEAIEQIEAVIALLSTRQRAEPVVLVRHEDGRLESLMQAAAGRLNPQALPIEWVHRPAEPPPGTEPSPVEVTARCTFTAAHGGSPGRVHGGVLALALDEITGVAIRAAGGSGMTVALEVALRGAVPFGQPVDLAARYTGGEGRKAYATGEVIVDGQAVVSARALYVTERR